MKSIAFLVVLTAVVLLGLLAGNRPAYAALQNFKPTFSGDDHDNPVYTSPTNDLKATHWQQTNSLPVVPALTNWPVTNLPPTTNWPSTNLPAMTNPPGLLPPGK